MRDKKEKKKWQRPFCTTSTASRSKSLQNTNPIWCEEKARESRSSQKRHCLRESKLDVS